MSIILQATLENKQLKLAWSDFKSRPWPYLVLLSTVQAESERVRRALSAITQQYIDAERQGNPIVDYACHLPALRAAGAALYAALFDAMDNPGAAQEAEDMVRGVTGCPPLSIFSEVCIP